MLTFIIFQDEINQKDIEWLIENCLDGNNDLFYGFIVPTIKFRSKQISNLNVNKLMTYVSYGDDIKKESFDNYFIEYQTL